MSSRAHIPAENLNGWREQAAENRELRHLQIAMIAKVAANALENGTEFPYHVPELRMHEEGSNSFWNAMATDEKLAFCREILAARPDLFPDEEHILPPPAHPRVARLAGDLFSRAAGSFSRLLPKTSPVYLSSLTELLEETAAGSADFALLPIEDAKGNRFLHFYEELDRLDLHVSHTCDVFSEEEGRPIRFALISKLYRPETPFHATALVECRVPGEDRKMLTDLLTVASDAGLTLRRSDALPAAYSEDSFVHYPVFFAPKGTALLDVYLRLFLPGVAVVGRYFHLQEVENR